MDDTSAENGELEILVQQLMVHGTQTFPAAAAASTNTVD
jgi:hypothetical protein